ncbi:unnamed protein product [Vitrella brassicaformis CCMP3155]|uniref:Uncharacterized protein n=1 Tax=Vitrella brassicaformis (strain CCMP3155) TaxID=1169540 RepID=A0A0G4FTP6_VITBC|nr:unnamed protein product [Vitrella brassicaformis CCMP3155]|eukprot:CEM17789.1 unnamed protein product [Vitrella brassicaformis CCMP3155]
MASTNHHRPPLPSPAAQPPVQRATERRDKRRAERPSRQAAQEKVVASAERATYSRGDGASEDIPTSISCHGMSDSELLLEEACKNVHRHAQPKMKGHVWAMREACAHDQLVAEDQRKPVHLKEHHQLLSQLPTPCFPDLSFMDGLLFRHALQACVRGGKVLEWDDLTLDALHPSCLYRDEPLNLVTSDYVPSPLVAQAAVADAPIQIMKTLLAYNADVDARGHAGQANLPDRQLSYNTSTVGAAAMCHHPDMLRFLLREAEADPRVPAIATLEDRQGRQAAAAGAMEEGGGVDSPAAAAHERKRQELRERMVQMEAMARAMREACAHDLPTPEGRRKRVEDHSLLSSLPKPMVSYMNGFVLKQALHSCAMYGSAGSLDTLLQDNFIKPTEEGGDEGLPVGQVRATDGEVLSWRDLSPFSIEPFEGEMIEPDGYVRKPLLIEAMTHGFSNCADDATVLRIVKSLVEYNADVKEIGVVAMDCKTREVMKSPAVGAASLFHLPEVLDYLLQQPRCDPSVLSEGDFIAGLNLLQLACDGNQHDDAPQPPSEPMVGTKSRKKATSKGKRAGIVGLAEEAGQQAAGGVAAEAEQKEEARQSRAVATLEVIERHGLTRSTPAEAKGGRRKKPGLSLQCRDKTGSSLLHVAAANGWSGIVEWLLKRGLSSGRQQKERDTPRCRPHARHKAAAADLLREEEQARKEEERAARKREQKRLKRLAAEQAESAADGEMEEADDTQHETEEVDQVTEEAAAPSCPPDTQRQPAFSDAPGDHQQQRNVLSQKPPADVGPSAFAPLPLSPAHGTSASHSFAAQRPSSSSSSFVDPPASSTVSTTPADRPSSAQTSTRQDQFCPADVTAQLRADLNGCIDKKESLEDQYRDLLAARRWAADRVKELKTNIRRLEYVTPNLSHDVLVSLATAAEVREFEAKISREEVRLDELLVAAAQHAMRLQSGAIKPTKAPAAEPQSALGAAAAGSASTPMSTAEGCGMPVCGAMRVMLNESSTEHQLLEAIQHIQYDIDQLEGDISRMTHEHSEIEASLQPLEQEHHTLQHEAKKRLTPARLESLSSVTAVEAFQRDIKSAKQQLRELSKEATIQRTILEKEGGRAANSRILPMSAEVSV